MAWIEKYITKRTAIYFPLSVTAFFALLDILNKIWDLRENKIPVFSEQHVNKGLQVLLGYFAISILTTATYMFLQQYNGEEKNYASPNGTMIFLTSIGYCIFYATYIIKFYTSVYVSGIGIIFTVLYAWFIFHSLSKTVGTEKPEPQKATESPPDIPVLDVDKCSEVKG